MCPISPSVPITGTGTKEEKESTVLSPSARVRAGPPSTRFLSGTQHRQGSGNGAHLYNHHMVGTSDPFHSQGRLRQGEVAHDHAAKSWLS